ncbi:MAG: hypothetical protein OEZ51_05400, partial [Nitrospinota bacterium]|nr:hypothetical protein [Nitrospinota bacterium]
MSVSGSDLTVVYDGQQNTIRTNGENAHGLVVDSSRGRRGKVSVSSNGDIVTNGTEAHGIVGRSVFLPRGHSGGNDDHPGKAGEDHGKAGQGHGKAGEDHGKAGEDHGKA